MATKRKNNALEIDFEGVESGGGARAIPDGTYAVKVKKVPTREEGADSGEPYLSWQFTVTKGKFKGATIFDNTSLQPQALWKLKSLLEAMGEEVPDSTMRMVLSEYVDRELQVEITNEDYNGKDRSRVTGYVIEGGEEADDADDSDDSDDDDDDKKSSSKKTKSKKSDDDDDGDDSDDDDDDDEDDDDAGDEDDDKPKGKGKRALARAAAKKKGKSSDDDDDEDDADADDEDDADEEDEKPAKKKGSASKIKKGARVSFDDDGKTVKGKVTEIDGSVATVDVKGDDWQVQIEDLTIIA